MVFTPDSNENTKQKIIELFASLSASDSLSLLRLLGKDQSMTIIAVPAYDGQRLSKQDIDAVVKDLQNLLGPVGFSQLCQSLSKKSAGPGFGSFS